MTDHPVTALPADLAADPAADRTADLEAAPVSTGVERVRAPLVADERTMLDAWLDFHRATLLLKCDGLTADQLAQRSVPPSDLSLLGLVRHMTEVERGWFADFAEGDDTPVYTTDADEDADFNDVEPARAGAELAAYHAEVASCRALVADLDLDDTYENDHGRVYSLRWIYVHMVEEYARHNGHADLLRQAIDGATGD
jgi:uncharacterized damage-inducible protein DinB